MQCLSTMWSVETDLNPEPLFCYVAISRKHTIWHLIQGTIWVQCQFFLAKKRVLKLLLNCLFVYLPLQPHIDLIHQPTINLHTNQRGGLALQNITSLFCNRLATNNIGGIVPWMFSCSSWVCTVIDFNGQLRQIGNDDGVISLYKMQTGTTEPGQSRWVRAMEKRIQLRRHQFQKLL